MQEAFSAAIPNRARPQKGRRALRSRVTHLLHVQWNRGDAGRARCPQLAHVYQSPPLCASISLKLPCSTQYGQRTIFDFW